MKKIYINLIGTDGSGKTTISTQLMHSLGNTATMIWCGSESILMKPIRYVLRKINNLKKENVSNACYGADVEKKRQMAAKSVLLKSLYIKFILMDYALQYKWKMFKTRDSKYVILDRYFFDVAVNLAIRLGWTTDELIKFIEQNIHRFHLPEVLVWVKVSSQISMERKDDIPDVAYVEIRLEYYQSIATRFDFMVIDGTEEINKNVKLLRRYVESKSHRRHVMYVHSNNEDIGGADFCLYRLAEEMKKKGLMVSCALRLDTAIMDSYRVSGICVFNKKFSRPQLSRGVISILLQPFRSLMDVFYFIGLYRTQRPDVVHVNDLYDFAPAVAATLMNIPSIYHIRMIRQNAFERILFSNIVNFFSLRSVSVSTPVHDHYFSKPRYSIDKHLVIYDWPNDVMVADTKNSSLVPDGMNSETLNVVMVGRLEWWKGQHIYLEAINQLNVVLNKSNVVFYLVGGTVVGADKEVYSAEVLRKAKQYNVVYLGSRSDVPDILRFADISVHASVTPDPFPGVVLESLLSGAATIGAKSGGVAEMIRDGKDGLLFEPSDSRDLADKMKYLIESKEARERFASSGRRRILTMTDKTCLLDKFESLYASN